MTEKMWKLIVETNFAGGYAHYHFETPEYGYLEIEDDYGQRGLWVYDKKAGKIELRG